MAVARMTIFLGKLGLAIVLAALCLGGRTAHAQAAPVPYWTPGWPLGFGGYLPDGQGANTYANFPGFDGGNARGSSTMRYNFPNGWFVGSERGGSGLSGFRQDAAFGNFSGLTTEGMQFGYNFKNAVGMPVTVYAGFDTLKYNTGIGNPFSPFDSTSGTASGYSANVGIEFQPTSNLSLSLGVGYAQQPGVTSPLLSGVSPFAAGVRR
jgi:opacity protein-like surface antigen